MGAVTQAFCTLPVVGLVMHKATVGNIIRYLPRSLGSCKIQNFQSNSTRLSHCQEMEGDLCVSGN